LKAHFDDVSIFKYAFVKLLKDLPNLTAINYETINILEQV